MRDRIAVSPMMYLMLPAALLLLPLRWIAAWATAISVHELGHYLALRLCRVPVSSLTVSPSGLKMKTGDIRGWQAILCALAGPLFSLCLTGFSGQMPCTAFCGWLQGIFNLAPIYPLDGGRSLRAVLQKLCHREQTVFWAETVIAVIFAAGAAVLGVCAGIGLLPIGMFLIIFLQKFLAKDGESRYNRKRIFTEVQL